jgi:hypothetical protein
MTTLMKVLVVVQCVITVLWAWECYGQTATPSSTPTMTATATPAPSVLVCIPIPVAKETPVAQARDLYNGRNGTNYTSIGYCKQLVIQGVTQEVGNDAHAQAQSTVNQTINDTQSNW